MPELLDDNRDIWYLLQLSLNQWRVGMEDPYGLDFGVIIEMARAMDMEINQIFFEKLKAYEKTVLDGIKKQRTLNKGPQGNA